MITAHQLGRAEIMKRGLLAGIAGGSAEIAFLIAIAALTNISAINVAVGVSASFSIAAFSPTMLALVGIVIHLALASVLGVAVAVGYHAVAGQFISGIYVYAVVLMALIIVWAFNFLFLLPIINPAFVRLVPYPISFASKVLFGLVAAEVLLRGAER